MKKLVTLLLVLAMIMSMTMIASAAEADTMSITEVSERRAHTFQRANAVGTDEYGYLTFETFEDLKELASATYSDWTTAYYTGSAEEFVISENIEIPESFELLFWDNTVKIPEGVTCTLKGYLLVDNLTVNGKLVIDDSNLNVSKSLTVNGAVDCSGAITLEESATLAGKDKIAFGEYGYIYKIYYPTTEDKVYEAMTAASNDKTGLEYNIYIDASMVLNSDFTIPANAMLTVWDSLTINGTCTVEGELYSWKTPVTVNGKLINNKYVTLDNTTLTISSGASYSGNGIIYCVAIKPENAIVGMSLDNFAVEDYGGSYVLTYVADKIKLGRATDLTWGVEHSWIRDEMGNLVNHPEGDVARAGVASFKRANPDQAEYEIKLYKDGQENFVGSTWWEMSATGYDSLWYDVHFIEDINESGDYYFTVTAKGDGKEYADGPTEKSEKWTYVKPAKALTTPTQLTWNLPNATFNVADNENDILGVFVEFYYTPVLGEEPRCVGATVRYVATDKVEVGDWVFENYGIGYYTFKVKLISNDLNTVANSEWSAISPTYYLEKIPTVTDKIITELDSIINAEAAPEEIRDAVQSIDTEILKEAMKDDTGNSGIMESIAALEEAVGGPAAVEVSEEAAAFDASKVSVVGANLNNAESESAPITLVLDKPEEEHVLDTLYNSAVAVSFSMDLDNVADTENLEVPVKITLPVPETINPNFLVILHYHANGTVEEVRPHIYRDGGQWYAEMVLTSFSDFVMTETVVNFKDISTDAFYYNPVLWAVENGITTGLSATSFGPDDPCNRGQVVTFLWRAAGCPAPTSQTHSFTDVKPGAFYYDAVLWAVENGITTGLSATSFGPDEICNRGQVATFLYRYAGTPAHSGSNPFDDVKEGDFFYNPVLWAKENGITTGTSATTFAPNDNCNRGQIVTFLYRAIAK